MFSAKNLLLTTATGSSLWAWGHNNYELGDGSPTNRLSPVQISASRWKSIVGKGIAIKDDGTLWCWGDNMGYQFGLGTSSPASSTPYPIQIGTSTWKMATRGFSYNGLYHTLAIKTDGTLWGWGRNDKFQLGNDSFTDTNTPVQIGNSTWDFVATASNHSVGIKTDGTLWSWGANTTGQLGVGIPGSGQPLPNSTSPIQVGSSTWTNVSAGDSTWYMSGHNIAIKSDGTLWTWGFGGYGQIGDGSTSNRFSPVQISASRWKELSVNGGTMAIKEDGTLWAWGPEYRIGQEPDSSLGFETSLIPVNIGGNSKWKAVSAYANSALAIKEDGTLWGWGSNQYGELGDGTTTFRSSPTQIGSSRWKSVLRTLNGMTITNSLGIKE